MKSKLILLAVSSFLLIGCSTGGGSKKKTSSSETSQGGGKKGHINQERIITDKEKGSKISGDQAKTIIDSIVSYNETFSFNDADYLRWNAKGYMDDEHTFTSFEYARSEKFYSSFADTLSKQKVDDSLTYPNRTIFYNHLFQKGSEYIYATRLFMDGYFQENVDSEFEYINKEDKLYSLYTEENFNSMLDSYGTSAFSGYSQITNGYLETFENYFDPRVSPYVTICSSGDGSLYLGVEAMGMSVVEVLFTNYRLSYIYTMTDLSAVGPISGEEELDYKIITEEVSFDFDRFTPTLPDLSTYVLTA